MKFYIKYENEIIIYRHLCAALSFIRFIGGELFFKKPAKIEKLQMEMFI